MFLRKKTKKGLSPLITTILLIIVTFALIGVVLGWGKSFSNQMKTTTSSFENNYTKAGTVMIKPIKFYSNNRLILNDLMSDSNLTIVAYRIISDKNFPGLNTIVTLSQPLVLSTGDSGSITITRPPENKFDIQLLTNDNKYVTVNDIQNYALEPVSPTITSPSNDSSFPPDTNILFSETTTGGDGVYSCEWKADSNIICTSCDDFNYSFSSGGVKTIYLKVTDLEGNTKTISSTLTIIPPLSVSITSPSNNYATYTNTTIDFNSSISGGTGSYSCEWYDGVNLLSSNCNFSTSFSISGSYDINLVVSDSGLVSSKDVNITIYAPLSVSITSPVNNNTYTIGSAVDFNSTITGGDGSYSCLWKDNSLLLSSSCNFNKTYSGPGWSTGADLLENYRQEGGLGVVGSKLYYLEGYSTDSTHNYTTNIVESYDVTTNSWSTKTASTNYRSYLSCTAVGTKIYCFGGHYGSNQLSTVEEYDSITDTWTTKTSMPTARSSLSCVPVDTKIYCFGGYDGSSHLSTVEEYDSTTDTWTTKTSMPSVRSSLSCVLVDTNIFCIGGSNSNGYSTNNNEIYNILTNSWSIGAVMPIDRFDLSCVAVGRKIYCFGGNNSSGTKPTEVDIYDIDTNSWSIGVPMPTDRSYVDCAIIDNKIYCAFTYYNNKLDIYTPGDAGAHNITLDVNDSSGSTKTTDVNITVN